MDISKFFAQASVPEEYKSYIMGYTYGITGEGYPDVEEVGKYLKNTNHFVSGFEEGRDAKSLIEYGDDVRLVAEQYLTNDDPDKFCERTR